MYRKDGSVFTVKTLDQFVDHVSRVTDYLKKHPRDLRQINRIFLGAGNALAVDTGLLLAASQYALQKVSEVTNNRVPNRLAIYGNTKDILDKGREAMRLLHCGGVCGACSIDRLGTRRGVDVIYWGVESGYDKILQLSGKGYTQSDAATAGDLITGTGGKPSVMIMPGLGGVTYWDGHVTETARLLNYIEPNWITFIGLKIDESTPYYRWMSREQSANRNRSLLPTEIAEQTAQMIERLDFHTRIGVHGDDVHTFGHNPFPIGVAEISDRYDAKAVAAQIRMAAQGNSHPRTRIARLF